MDQLTSLKPEIDKEFQSAQAALEYLRATPVVTHEDLDAAGKHLVLVKTEAKRIDAKKQTILGPLNEAVKAVRDLFRPVETHLSEAESILKRKMSDATQAIEAENRAAALATQAALAANNVREAAALSAHIVEVPTQQGVSYRDVWEFVVTDTAAVPRDFMVIDEKKIAAYVKFHGDQNPIPGVTVTKNKTVIARTK